MELLSGPSFGPIGIVVSSDSCKLSYDCVCAFLCPIIWQFSKNMVFEEKGANIVSFFRVVS